MIKTMTKHLIYNMCINVFFDTVISNYIKPHIKKDIAWEPQEFALD